MNLLRHFVCCVWCPKHNQDHHFLAVYHKMSHFIQNTVTTHFLILMTCEMRLQIPTKSDHFLAIKKSMSWKKRKRLKGTILVWSSICKMTRIWNITIYFLCPLHKWDLYVPILWKCNFLKYFSISEGLDKVMSSNLCRASDLIFFFEMRSYKEAISNQ